MVGEANIYLGPTYRPLLVCVSWRQYMVFMFGRPPQVLDKLWRETNGAVYPSSTGLQMAVADGNVRPWRISGRGYSTRMDACLHRSVMYISQ